MECADGTYYTGVTTDLTRRLHEHNHTKKGAAYTRSRRPVTHRYTEGPGTKSWAMHREYEIKAMKRKEKERLL